MEPDVFEGQMIRLLKECDYVDAANAGLELAAAWGRNPTQSVWVCHFYDRDVLQGQVRPIEAHAEDRRLLVCEWIPSPAC